MYNFLHLQIQELLAAFHISKLPPSEQMKIFKDLFGQSRFAAVFEFYAAFTKLETEGIREIVASMVTYGSKDALVSIFRCLYEAQDISLCGYVVSLLGGKLELHGTSLRPVDCLSVGYFLRCTCLTTTGKFELDLCDHLLDGYKIACVAEELSKCCNDRHVKFEIRLGSSVNLGMTPDKGDVNPYVVLDLPGIRSDIVTPLLRCCCVFSLDVSGHPVELYLFSQALANNSSLVKLRLFLL